MIAIPSLPVDTPEGSMPVKSYALFWKKSALEMAIQEDITLENRKLSDGSFHLFCSCKVGCTRTNESHIGYIEMPA
ncbi:hypothetical protein [Candidatus Liberibacter sp.]|uniref:hypothetical protein n=1 Tax=Candidatus Liberibacter sp. TaxID=34022 RepID=UPI0015F53009|nr:hypothetical protein [Candidatus Liberibacter sp.]MBA5724347.1 hypothetical protein [Candidatus Liberibacter sp.]